jgi:preprotein translocase subunit SecB
LQPVNFEALYAARAQQQQAAAEASESVAAGTSTIQ